MESILSSTFVLLDVMIGNPEPCDTGPEWTWKLGQRMKEAVINDLIDNLIKNVCYRGEDDI